MTESENRSRSRQADTALARVRRDANSKERAQAWQCARAQRAGSYAPSWRRERRHCRHLGGVQLGPGSGEETRQCCQRRHWLAQPAGA